MTTSFSAELFDNSHSSFLKIKDSIVALEEEAFEVEPFTQEVLMADFLDSKNIVVILKKNDTEEVVGFTYAKPMEPETPDSPARPGETAWMWDTVIKKEYRGMHLLPIIMERLEGELKKRGFKYVERNAMVANGYAQAIARHYKGRIIKSFSVDSKWGPQVFFRIKL
jgi:ribosomal protein S18 acetylase RimI-like enzyme